MYTEKILITGGAGYIGSHTVLELLENNYEVVILDNLCNSSQKSLAQVEFLTNKKITFIEGDILDSKLLDKIFAENAISSVIHFAGLKAVGQSVKVPDIYYHNNVIGSLTLFEAMKKANVFKIVFSSSATVYGDPKEIPVSESCPTSVPKNPYGKSKLMVEQILQDFAHADDRWSVALLRYFNPVGAHSSGLIGEDPKGIPNNLVPYISQVASGKLEKLSIFGGDYPTKDGTGIRDYIHVTDLAQGHLAALGYISSNQGSHVWNLGTGEGYSVLEMIKAFKASSHTEIPYQICSRREGDIAKCWSNPSKALKDLGWQSKLGLTDMVKDTWRWQSKNPNGFTE